MVDDWDRSPGWTAQDQVDFEARLKRARAYNRSQHVRIKALALLGSPDPELQQAGMVLLRRVIEEFPEDRLQVTMAHEQLGDEQRRLGHSRSAIDEYRRCIAIMGPTGNGTSGMVRMKLAELLAGEGRMPEAKSEFEQAERDSLPIRIIFPAAEFEFHRVGVGIAQADGDAESATSHARAALDAASATRSGAAKHPHLGLVSADPATLEELRVVARMSKRRRGWLRGV